MVGPRDGPTLLSQNVVEGREKLSHVHGKTQQAPGPGSLGQGSGEGTCQGPSPLCCHPPYCSRVPSSHPTKPGVAIYKAPETKTEHLSHSAPPRWETETKRGTRTELCPKHPTSQVGARVEPRFPDLYPQQFPAQSEAVSTGPRGQLEKNAVQPVI